MQSPNVRTSMRDEANRFTYHVLAYRQLSRSEMLHAIAMYRLQPSIRKKKRAPQNGAVTILSLYGATERI